MKSNEIDYRLLGYSNHIGLNTYVKKRNLRESMGQTKQEFSSRENITNIQGVINSLWGVGG